MKIKNVVGIATIAVAALTLGACSSSNSASPAIQDDGFTNFFDNNAFGEDGLDIVTTGYPDSWSDCDGNAGFNPVLISNFTGQDQTVSVTINPSLSRQVANGSMGSIVSQMQQTANENGCMAGGGGTSTDVTIPAGQTFAGALLAGGVTGPHSDVGSGNNNLAIGSGGSQWYQLRLGLGLNNGFQNWQLNYAKTGGTADAGEMVNNQPGMFNAVSCSTTPIPGSSNATGKYVVPSGFNVTQTYISPWQSSVSNQQTYKNNAPICFAFLGVGGGTPVS